MITTLFTNNVSRALPGIVSWNESGRQFWQWDHLFLREQSLLVICWRRMACDSFCRLGGDRCISTVNPRGELSSLKLWRQLTYFFSEVLKLKVPLRGLSWKLGEEKRECLDNVRVKGPQKWNRRENNNDTYKKLTPFKAVQHLFWDEGATGNNGVICFVFKINSTTVSIKRYRREP